jgi:hypothetical protein
MTKNDEELLEKAKKLTSIDWSYADMYAKQADSIEVKKQLESIAKTLYHKEEYFANCI